MHSAKRQVLLVTDLLRTRLKSQRAMKRLCLAGAALFLCLALAPLDAYAQLRGLGGGGSVGGIGGVPGIGGSGALPGAGGLDLPGAVPSAPIVPDRIGTGLSLPTNTGPITNTLNGAVTNTLAVPGRVTNGLGNTVNQVGRRLANTAARRSGVPPAGERRFVPDEVVVGLPSNLSPQALNTLARRHNLTRLESQRIRLTGTTFHRWRIDDRRSVSNVIRALEADAGVRTAQPNYRFTLAQHSNAANAPNAMPASAMQYAIEKLQLSQAHRLASGEKVLIAVIDSGIDTTHPELAGHVAGSFDALNSKEPAHGHGTAMASAIIAHAELKGAAPAARILAIRAFGATRSGAQGTTLPLLRTIDWAVAHGARVINMSFVGPTDPEVARSLAAARKKGIVLVAAAGNAGPKSPPLFPASDTNVIAVTATDSEDNLLPVANRGKHIAVAAPGVDIVAAAPEAGYQFITGTSIAAAQVSGVVALLLELKPDLTPDAVRKILLGTATDLGPKGRDDQFGSGLANANRAVLSLSESLARSKPANVSAAAR